MKRRTVLSGAAVTAFAGLSAPQRAHAQTPPQPTTGRPARPLTVLSYNAHHCAGTDGVLSTRRIAEVIIASGADVIGLQEIDNHYGERSQWADQTAELAAFTGFHAVFGANIDDDPPEPGRPRIQYGTAILSRYPILSWSNTRLTNDPALEPRGLLHARINIRGAKLDFFTTHLAVASGSDRLAQARDVLAAVSGRERVIVTGDLNATPSAPEITALTEALTDVWPTVGRGPGFTFPNLEPDRRIDYVLANAGVLPQTARVLDLAPQATDHRGLLAWVNLR